MPTEKSLVFDKYLGLITLEQKRVRLASSLSQAETQLRSTVQSLRAAVNKNPTGGGEFEIDIRTRHKRVVELQAEIAVIDIDIDALESELPLAARSLPGSVLARPPNR